MNKVLMIIDPQNDFLEGGSLPVLGGKKALDNLINYCKGKYYNDIMITKDYHPKNHCSFIDNGGKWPEHCVAKTTGCEIYGPLKEALSDYLYYYKGCDQDEDEYSIFSPNNTYGKIINKIFTLYKKEPFTIYIAGVAGDVCVKNTILDLIRLGYRNNIVVLKSCIASLDGGKYINDLINFYKLKSE